MHRLVILFVFVWIDCQGAEIDRKECVKLFRPITLECCKDDGLKLLLEKDKDTEECIRAHAGPPKKHTPGSPPSPPPCDVEICIAEKKGYLNEDGTINKEVYKDMFQKDFGDNPTLVKRITEKCLEGNLDNYGPPDFCDLHKLNHCVILQGIISCPKWDEENTKCSEVKNYVEKCQD